MTDRDKVIAAMLVEGERRALDAPETAPEPTPPRLPRDDPRWLVGEWSSEAVRSGDPATAPTIDSGEVKNDPVVVFESHDGRPATHCPCGAFKITEWGFDPMSPCVVCGRPDPRTVKSPFDPSPRALEPSTYGYVWCRWCEAPVDVAGHGCALNRSGT